MNVRPLEIPAPFMLSVHTVNSIIYLLESALCNEYRRNGDSYRSVQKYYESDPFKRPAHWLGNIAQAFGLSEVTTEEFEDLFYGFKPRPADKEETKLRSKLLKAIDQLAIQRNTAPTDQKAMIETSILELRSELKRLHLLERAQTPFIEGTPSREEQIENAKQQGKLERKIQTLNQELRQLKTLGDSPERRVAIGIEIKSLQSELKALKASPAGRRAASDFVFSAPKSVSLLWAWSQCFERNDVSVAIEKAQRAAVETVLKEIESQYLLWRHRTPALTEVDEHGKNVVVAPSSMEFEKIKGMIVAMFDHFESRSVDDGIPDPQLHTHCSIFNIIQNFDGQHYSAFNDYLLKNIKGLGAAYRSVLADELIKSPALSGLNIRRSESREHKDVVNFEIDGIDEGILKQFSKRSRQILAAHQEQPDRSKGDLSVITRKAKKEYKPEDLLTAWKGAFERLGMSQDWELTPSKKNESPASDDDIVKSLFERDTYFSHTDLKKKIFEEAQFYRGDKKPMEWAQETFKRILKRPEWVAIHDPRGKTNVRGIDRFNEAFYTSETLLKKEQAFFGQTLNGLLQERPQALMSAPEVQSAIDAIEQGLSFKLRDFQRDAVAAILTNKNSLNIQIAGAGFGKTTAAKVTKQLLEAQGLNIISCAPSNTAAMTLNHDLGLPVDQARSVDKLLLDIENEKVILNSSSVVMVDEAGMVGFDNYEKLMSLVQAANARVILMGDTKQLNSVGRGDVLRRLVSLDNVQHSSLFKVGEKLSDASLVSRQKVHWQKVAAQLASAGHANETWELYESHGMVKLAADQEAALAALCTDFLSSSCDLSKKIALASTNQHCHQINTRIRSALIDKKVLGPVAVTSNQGMEFRQHDRVMLTDALDLKVLGLKGKLPKNTVLTVDSIDRSKTFSKVTFKTEDGNTFTLNGHGKKQGAMLNNFTHAYAQTVHKSQGKTVDEVFYAPSAFVSRELFYVAVSRHRDALKLYASADVKDQIVANASLLDEKDQAFDLTRVCQHATTPVRPNAPSVDRLQNEEVFDGQWIDTDRSMDWLTHDSQHVYARHPNGWLERYDIQDLPDHHVYACRNTKPSVQQLKNNDELTAKNAMNWMKAWSNRADLRIVNGALHFLLTERMPPDQFEAFLKAVSPVAHWHEPIDGQPMGSWQFKSLDAARKALKSFEPASAETSRRKNAMEHFKLNTAHSIFGLTDEFGSGRWVDTMEKDKKIPFDMVHQDNEFIYLKMGSDANLRQILEIPKAMLTQDQRANLSSSQAWELTFDVKGSVELARPAPPPAKPDPLDTWGLDDKAFRAIRDAGVSVKAVPHAKDKIKFQLLDHDKQFIVLPHSSVTEAQRALLKGGQTIVLGLDQDKKPFKFEVKLPALSLVDKVSNMVAQVVHAIPFPRQEAKPMHQAVQPKPEPPRPFIKGLEDASMKTLREGRWIKMATTVKKSIEPFDGPGVVAHCGSVNKGSHCLAAVFDPTTNTLHQVPVDNKEVLKSLKEVQGWPVTFMKDSMGKVGGLDLPEMKTNWASMKPEQRTMTHTVSQFQGQTLVDFEILRISNDRIYFAHGDKHPRKALVLDRSTDHPTLQKLQKIPNATLQLLVGTHCKLSFENGQVTQWVALDPHHSNRTYDFNEEQVIESWWCARDEVHRANVEEQRRAQWEYEWSRVKDARSFDHSNDQVPSQPQTTTPASKPMNAQNQGWSR